jgi:hypothetical protein
MRVLLDSTIAAYGVLYFISDHGRPRHWIADRGSRES